MKKLLLIVTLIVFQLSSVFSQEDILIANGDKEISKKNYSAAASYYTRALAKNPKNNLVYYKRANAYLYANVIDSALNDFNHFILRDSTSADAFNNRGVIYTYMDSHEAALTDFDWAVRLDSNFVEALINRASAFFNLGLVKQANEDFSRAESLNKSNPQLFYQRGRLNYYQTEYKKSIEDFSTAIKLGLKNPKIYYNRANSYFKSEEYEKAIKDYTKVLEFDPNDNEALNNRAVAYDKIGKEKLADKDREKLRLLLEKDPKFIPFDKLVFRRYSDKDSLVSLELPEGWNILTNESENVIDIVITPESVKSVDDYFSAGIRLSYNKNMQKLYGVSSADSLIDFWKGSLNKNTEEYARYRPISQKMFKKAGFTGHTNKVIVKVNKEAPTMKMYETAYAKQDILIYLYLQSLEQQFSYYEKIFDKSLETILLR